MNILKSKDRVLVRGHGNRIIVSKMKGDKFWGYPDIKYKMITCEPDTFPTFHQYNTADIIYTFQEGDL